jgi:hypothetical protein
MGTAVVGNVAGVQSSVPVRRSEASSKASVGSAERAHNSRNSTTGFPAGVTRSVAEMLRTRSVCISTIVPALELLRA